MWLDWWFRLCFLKYLAALGLKSINRDSTIGVGGNGLAMYQKTKNMELKYKHSLWPPIFWEDLNPTKLLVRMTGKERKEKSASKLYGMRVPPSKSHEIMIKNSQLPPWSGLIWQDWQSQLSWRLDGAHISKNALLTLIISKIQSLESNIFHENSLPLVHTLVSLLGIY